MEAGDAEILKEGNVLIILDLVIICLAAVKARLMIIAEAECQDFKNSVKNPYVKASIGDGKLILLDYDMH